MAYLIEEKFDLNELLKVIEGVLPDDNGGFIHAGNLAVAESSLLAAKDFVTMRLRKRKAEEGSYRIAK